MTGIAIIALAPLLPACAAESVEPPATVATTSPPTSSPAAVPTQGPPPQARRYKTLQEVADAIGCTDLEDLGTGGNAGLRAFGICNLGEHNIDIWLVTDSSWRSQLAADAAIVYGPGWIVTCPTGKEAAREVRRRVGGTVSIP